MEQRKLIKLGNSSFALALPKEWVDKSGLKKGDNIFVERLWRSVKYECIYLREWDSVYEVKEALKAYFQFYNHARPHQSLSGNTPSRVHAQVFH